MTTKIIQPSDPTELTLRRLTLKDEVAFRNAVKAWDQNPGFMFARGFDPAMPFVDYLTFLKESEGGDNLATGLVADTILCAFVNKEIVGRVSIRHTLNDFLFRIGGHIGYGVLPLHRRKGYATQILQKALEETRRMGLEKVLVTCDDTNVGSIRTIEKCGGVLENKVDAGEGRPLKRRYWITNN